VYKRQVYISIIISFFVVFISFLTSSFANNQGDLFWILVLTLFTFYMIGKVWAIVYIIVNICNMITIKLLSLNGVIEKPFQSVEPLILGQVNYVINLIACCILFLYLVAQILREYENAQSDLIKNNAILKSKEAEKSVMLREIHHRVKNNLQVIISLLRLQSFQLDDSSIETGAFQDSITRIATMALIHEKMYKGDNIESLNVEKYIDDLTSDILETYTTSTEITIDINSNIGQLKLDDLVPFSLILNELITNSIKHGFKNASKGTIEIILTETTSGFDFTYKDSGVWQDSESDQSFGLELIDTLNDHFEGTYHKKISENGTEYKFKYKLF